MKYHTHSNGVRLGLGAILLPLILLASQLTPSSAARQNPLKDPKICGRPQCDPISSKFSYTDTIYKYDYNLDLRTEFSGSGENTSDLFLRSRLEIFFPKPCEGFLRITDVKLFDKPEETTSVSSTSSSFSNNDDVYDYYSEVNEADKSQEEEDVTASNQYPKSNELAGDLKRHVLRFAFHDGLISEVCPNVAEPAWVLNFKKGILSAFQNTMLRFDVDFNTTETDVSGMCHVQYALESADDVFVTIRKVKDITTCRNRYATQSVLQTTPYTFREDKTIWPILNSESYCNMTIDNNIYREISCYERHQLIPFSNSSAGAVTTSKTKFDYKGEESYSSSEFLAQNSDWIEKRSTLLFDHTPAVKPTHDEIKASRDLLKEMCNLGFPNIQREFIDMFTNFLQTTKSLEYKALTQLLARSGSICENGKNHVLESLPYIGSTASYQLMRDQIVANAISRELAQSWMASLSFIQRPDEETLETFYTILEFSRKKIDPEYTLGASAVIHNYCKHNSGCADQLKVQRIVNLLETEFLNLFNMYRGERRTRERMIIILKGLGNIGVISPPFAEQLQEVIVEDIAPVDVRLQSVLAFRRVDCLLYRKFFLDTYGNFALNSEIRIFSYLQAMRCPDYNSVNVIKQVLEGEQINQVGSFVWSHLKNLAKSSSPVRIEAQGLLLDDDLSDKFKLDIRKFSRNYEHSLFFDEYNFGSTADMNLIFGMDSYLPRMATLNFTADLFGQSVNFFEFSARAEGFEELVASIFGPKGPLNREVFRKKLSFLNRWLGNESSEDGDTLDSFLNIENLRLKRGTAAEVDDSTDNIEEVDYDFEEEPERRKRDVPSATEARKASLKQDIDGLGYKLKYDYNNPRAQIGLRIFGNDLRYYSTEGLLEVMNLAKEFDPYYQASKILSGKEFTYTKSGVFLDASYNVPLGIGLPLAIQAFGASSVDLRISGSLERMDPTPDWNFDVEGRFKPSVSLDVIVTMQSDMFYTSSGIKVKSNLYSNSEVEAKLKVRGKNLISCSFNLPQDKNEIFSARSELLVVKGDTDVPQAGIENRRANSTCTWPVLDKAVGLQMCSYFSVPDFSKNSDVIHPSLMLSGPLNFSMVLMKSDPTASKYVFEYKWDQVNNDSNWSIIFNTPGSSVKRLLVMNVTTVPDQCNASVSFENGAKTAAAGFHYSGDSDNRRLDFFFDTNGNRSLDLNMELLRWQDRTAWVYKPRMLLAVNGVNITGLVGIIRINEKNGIAQNDVELSFETRKLQALIRGNVVQSEVTTSTNMTVTYRFQANRVETINFDGKLVNMGDKSKTEYRSNVNLRTTAYPKLNFASNGTWLSLQGHTEGVVTYNNAPNYNDPQHTSSVRLIFARAHSEDLNWEGSRTRASLEVKVPRSKVDFRVLVKHEERTKNGTEHNIVLGLRYAPEKEATGLFSWHLPKRSLFAIDAYMNITIPEFNSTTARLKLTEIASKDYMINFNGSWFTGHSLSIKGNYKDHSSRVQALHHLKLLVESPSFEATTLNVVYRRNQLIIFADLQATYGRDPYGVSLQYATNPDSKNSNLELRLRVKKKYYWMNAKLLSEQPKLLIVEVHLDKLRDIYVKIGLLAMDKRKELSLELKWDANRDPSQRLGLLAEYNNPGNKKYDGNVMVTYPDRTVSCGFEAFTGGPKYYGMARASWSISEMIVFTYDAGLMPGKNINNWLHAELSTPFESWGKNSLQAGVYNVGNLVLVNSSLLWANDQLLQLGFKSDYDGTEPVTHIDVRAGINSTVKDIPTINVKVKHWQDLKKFDTDLELRYSGPNDTFNVYSMKSNWELFHSQRFQNVTGTMLTMSPFEGYRKGGLAAKFSLSDQREVQGAASLNFDIREFTLAVAGYVKKFTNNMLTVNITTPLEKFRTINGRFGLNEQRRHAVAEMRAPTTAVGAEALFDVKTLTDFDVKLSVATPIEDFKQAALIAKVDANTVDFRGLWHNVTLGFTGVWRKHNLTDFEYSYRVFTPLTGYEHNGVIAKLIKEDVFILELHGQLSQYKLGVKVNGRPKSKLLNQLGSEKIELEILYDDDFQPPKLTDIEDYDVNDVDYDEFFSYYVDFEVDTLVWPTIHGAVDVQEVMDFYLTVAHLQLPQGRVDAKDRLYFPDYINVLNVLQLNTPFPVAKEIKSIVEYHVKLDFNSFYERVEVVISNIAGQATEVGFEFNYTKIEDALKPKQHEVKLNLKTPFELIPSIAIAAKLELEDNIYRGNISSRTTHTFLSLAGAVESEENFLETSVGILLNTSVIPHYAFRAYFKKDFADIDNTVDVRFEVADKDTINQLQIACDWHEHPLHLINAHGQLQTTWLPLKLAQSSILLTKGPDPQLNFDLGFVSQNGQRIDYGTRASKKKDVFNVEIWTPMRNFKNISMHGSLVKNPTNPKEYKVSGQLYRNMATYALNGVVRMGDGYPADTRLRVQPKAGGRDGVIELSITEAGPGQKGMNFQFSAVEDGQMCQISGGYSINDETGLDFSMLVQSTEPDIARINLNGNLRPQEKRGHTIAELSLETPWKQLGIESVRLRSDVDVQRNGGKILGEYYIGPHIGRGSCGWSWLFGEDMQLLLESYTERPSAQPRTMLANARFLNPNKNYQRLVTGGKLNVDSQWQLELNGSLNYRSADDLQAGLIAQLPLPVGDIHHMSLRYYGNVFSQQGVQPNLFAEGKYQGEQSQRKFMSRLSYRNVTDLQGMGHVQWGVANNMSVVEGDFQMLRKRAVRREFYAKLITPRYKDEHTFFLSGNYDLLKDEYHSMTCAIDYPASRRVADMDVAFMSFNNMHGHLNGTTAPLLNVSWFRTDFNFSTNAGETYRLCRAAWPSDTGYVKLHHKYATSQQVNHDLEGTLDVDVPLQSRHQVNVVYGLNKRELKDNGYLKARYNNAQVLDGLYKSTQIRRQDIYKEETDITLENDKKPLGIHYVHTRDLSRPQHGSLDIKHVELYELRNSRQFNLTGELHSRHRINEQEYKIVAVHPNRTVVFTTNHEDVSERVSRQKGKLELSQTAWIGYKLEIGNHSTFGNDSQNFAIELSYPKRTLGTEGGYYLTEKRFDSNMAFKWTTDGSAEAEQKAVRTRLHWQAEPLRRGDRDHQTLRFTLAHPSLEKELTCKGRYYRSAVELLNANLIIDYSHDPNYLIELGVLLKDLQREVRHTNYTLKFWAHHLASELDVRLNASAAAKPSYYKTESYAVYKRDYYPEAHGKFLVLLDLNKKEVDYERKTPYRAVRFWAIPRMEYPVYGLNATIWDTPDTNNTGYVYIDLARRTTRMDVNLTDDASQNLQMVGYIPDARSGYLDVWRNYEEIRIIDISSYLKMNHSRLITGRFHWRPKIRDELQEKINAVGTSIYNSFSDGIDFWIKTMYTESVEAISVVWEKTKEYNEDFINDIAGLSVLEEDLNDLRTFVNQSYEANDFYIKTVVNFTLTILDELAIRDHIESLPKVFSELWHVMGDSGKALRNSIVWLIKAVKTTYNNVLDAVSRFFHGESLQYLSSLLEKGVEKYDKFVKDMHISFIKYVENLWNKFWSMMSNYWRSVLKRLEPHVFKLMSYIETTAWNLSKELFDFIYKRTNELAESPYFNQVSSFTQDVDRLYKDIKSHDAITNVRKYSAIAWNFIKEKYFKVVPFGAELNEVLTEILDEINQLQNIDQVQIVMQKYNEIMGTLDWIAEELQFEQRVHQLYALLRNKFRNYAMNALETADMYREAKTKFIFDPEVGHIDLEQKLPMSWHAFNETPKYEEIPEYRMLARAQNFFSTTNSSIVKYVYDLRRHLDPKTWLPPYYSRALIMDSRHYMTFDQRFVGLNLNFEEMTGQRRNSLCSYLLAHDFHQGNFTLMLEPATSTSGGDVVATRKLSFVANGQLLEIDLGSDSLTVNGNAQPLLPLRLGDDVTVHRDLDVLSIQSDTEFSLECNMQFDMCWFQASGWYFGRTAGLLGTMNNEHFDEYRTASGALTEHVEQFTDSWSVQKCKQKQTSTPTTVAEPVAHVCDEFFHAGMFSACVDTVDVAPFHSMCLDLGGHSNPVRAGHPAVKGACTAALAYIEACAMAKVPIRVPHQCVFCQLANGTYVPEGKFVELNGTAVPRSTDVVFIVEAKPCNANLKQRKNIMTVVTTLEEQLQAQRITGNRYAVLAFGGSAPFDSPRSIIRENRVFVSDFQELEQYFAHISVQNGTNNDILQAISAASKLNFRPGVSKTFVLLSCSNCAAQHMRFDYTSIRQFMQEEGVNLHILADMEFEFERTRKLRHFFGMDRELVYSKRFPEGDADTRQQLYIPKTNLGICTPLAMETNGSVFSARKLLPERRVPIKRFATIFAKRVAKSAVPNANQTCECSGHNTGVAYVACSPSTSPTEEVDVDDYDLQFNNWEWNDVYDDVDA